MSDRLIVSTRKGLFDLRRARDGAWGVERASFLGSPVTSALKDARDGMLYAALDLGHFGVKLHRSEDDGVTWKEIATPSYAGVDAEAADPPSLKLLWSLEPGGTDQPGTLWAGTIPGGLFRSDDRGDSWTLNRGLWDDPSRSKWFGGGYDKPGIHSVSVDPSDSRRIAIAISTAGVWETRDGGETWTLGGKGLRAAYMPPDQAHEPLFQDVHRLARCPSAPDQYWIQHHNGVFRSTNGVADWEELEPPVSNFGFVVAAHPTDPQTAWFVPAQKDEFRYPVQGQFIVNRTRDGGRSFETLRTGLPQRHAYDLVYRHGLDVDASGQGLAMGSTTGGFWTSADGGDSWHMLDARLPPVAGVRFA